MDFTEDQVELDRRWHALQQVTQAKRIQEAEDARNGARKSYDNNRRNLERSYLILQDASRANREDTEEYRDLEDAIRRMEDAVTAYERQDLSHRQQQQPRGGSVSQSRLEHQGWDRGGDYDSQQLAARGTYGGGGGGDRPPLRPSYPSDQDGGGGFSPNRGGGGGGLPPLLFTPRQEWARGAPDPAAEGVPRHRLALPPLSVMEAGGTRPLPRPFQVEGDRAERVAGQVLTKTSTR